MLSDTIQMGGVHTVTIGTTGLREGPVSASAARIDFENASVSTRAMADGSEARNKASTDSAFSALTETELKALDGTLLVEMMERDAQAVKHSGTAWARKAAQQAGREKEMDQLVLGIREVEERALKKSVTNALVSFKDLSSMPPIVVQALQKSLQRLGIYHGEIDGDRNNPALGGALESFADSHPAAKRLLDEGRISITSKRASDMAQSFATSATANSPSRFFRGEASILNMFNDNRQATAWQAALYVRNNNLSLVPG